MQADLFSAASLARTVTIPAAPVLDIGRYQEWPFPGSTPRETAQAATASSPEYSDMLAAVIKTQGGVSLSKQGLQVLVPDEWRKLLGKYTHANMTDGQCKQRGIEIKYLPRPDGGFVTMYQPQEQSNAGRLD